MFARWLPTVRSNAAVPAGASAGDGGNAGDGGGQTELAERHFPIPVVLAHGVFAVTTVIVVLIAAIQAK